jgi:DNA-binding CsgD family transcriptional regulator
MVGEAVPATGPAAEENEVTVTPCPIAPPARGAIDIDDLVAVLRPLLGALVAAVDRDRPDVVIRLHAEPGGPSIHIVVDRDTGGRREAPLSLQACPVTGAEKRVLRYLPTNLSIPEIAAQLNLSRHTVKSHAVAIYRKLGVTSRSAAVAVARDLGLLVPVIALAASPPSGDATGGPPG